MNYFENKAVNEQPLESFEEQTKQSITSKEHSAQFLRQRKFMLVLPLLVLPFLTMAFWALGGGKGDNEVSEKTVAGLNPELPDANLKDEKNFDKLSFYKQAESDSLKRAEALQNDPYYKNGLEKVASISASTSHTSNSAYQGINTSPYNKTNLDNNEQKIYQKIDALNKQINEPSNLAYANSPNPPNVNKSSNEHFSNDVDRLESMMQIMGDKKESDPELQQLGGTLDKILDIQHPERVKEKISEQSLQKKTNVFTVTNQKQDIEETYLKRSNSVVPKHNNQFYDESSSTIQNAESNSIAAVIDETKTITTGAIVKLRLLVDNYVNGILIPKGSFVFGNASLDNERLLISISTIRYKNNLLPVSLAVYDLDGLAGIYVPGSIDRDVAKQSSDQTLQSFELTSLDPSLKAQAATAGVNAAKTLLSKKVKLVKVTVKAGYRVLLKDNNKQND